MDSFRRRMPYLEQLAHLDLTDHERRELAARLERMIALVEVLPSEAPDAAAPPPQEPASTLRPDRVDDLFPFDVQAPAPGCRPGRFVCSPPLDLDEPHGD